MLRRIRIKGYKSLHDVEVRLRPLSVLFGPNAAGKSNFLDALQLLSRIVGSRTLKEAFDPPYRGKPLESFTFGETGLDTLLAKESASFMMEVDVELSPSVINSVNRQIREMRKGKAVASGSRDETTSQASVRERFLRYRVEVEIFPKSGILRMADEHLVALTSDGEPTKARRAFLEKMNKRLHLRMEGQAHPTYYEQYLDHSILSLPLYPPHYPHLVALREELRRYFFFYFEPRERMRAPNPVKEVRHIGVMGEELASFLNTLKARDAKQFKAVVSSLHMIVPSVSNIEVDVNSLGEVDLWLLEGPMHVPARVVSEGTLRVLGLLALSGVSEPPALIGFEEPENGIHPRRLKLIASLLESRVATGDTQLIVTTHSPMLPDMLPNDSLFVCQKSGACTEIAPFGTWGLLGRRKEIDEALDEHLTPSQRIMRGDFDA